MNEIYSVISLELHCCQVSKICNIQYMLSGLHFSVCRSSSTGCSMMTVWGRFFDVFHSHQMALSLLPQVPTQHAQNVAFTEHLSGEIECIKTIYINQILSSVVAFFFNLSWMCGDWRKHHKYHLYLFQEGPQKVTFCDMLRSYIFQVSVGYINADNWCCVSGPLPTYRVQLKPHWLCVAAPSTLNWGPRTEKARINAPLVNRQKW